MSAAREQFLRTVREAVQEGNRAGGSPPLPERGHVGYQGAGPDPVAKLRDELTAAGGVFHAARDRAEAVDIVLRLVRERGATKALLAGGDFIDSLDLSSILSEAGVAVVPLDASRDEWFSADIGITGVDHLVAETGTVVQTTRPDQPRSASLLPPVHIAIASRAQIVADLFDLFGTQEMPACLTLITGPSKTGDIELKLVTGVHGPGEVHVVVVVG